MLLLEIRVDRFRSLAAGYVLQKIRHLKRSGLPIIATVRSPEEGGARALSDSRRLELFKSILPVVDAIDLELGSAALRKNLVPLAHRLGKRVILSQHNFSRTPSENEMVRLIRKSRQGGADIVKLAVTPKTSADLARLFLLTRRHRKENLISVAMGKLGAPSRVLGFLFGSLLTYSFISPKPQAPGQLSFDRLLRKIKTL